MHDKLGQNALADLPRFFFFLDPRNHETFRSFLYLLQRTNRRFFHILDYSKSSFTDLVW